MTRILMLGVLMSLVLSAGAASRKSLSTAPTTFAPVPEGHELASIWNDRDFARRLIGSYGFMSAVEPTMKPEEQQYYNERIVPVLQEDPIKALSAIRARAKPGASAHFDFLLGTVLFQSGDTTNAIKHFEDALSKSPDFLRAQKNLAFALIRNERYSDAIKPLTRTVALGGGDSKVFALLGFAYMDSGRFASAEGAYRQALIFEPDNMEFKFSVVRCAVTTRNYDYALALLDELIQQEPSREAFWTLQANVLIRKEQNAEASVSLEMLRRLGRATPANLFLLGDLYMAQESRDLALSAYLEGVEKDAGENSARALRPAQILVSRGAWDEARQLFAKIRSSTGTELEGADDLKLLKLESKVAISTGQGEQAIVTLEEIIQRDPLDGEALLLAGDYYARNGQPEKAEFRYDTAAQLTGFEADAFVKHAQLLVQSQKYAQATELLHKAQKVKPRENVQRYLEKVEQLALSAKS